MANGASVAEGLPMPTQPDEQRAAMTEQRAAFEAWDELQFKLPAGYYSTFNGEYYDAAVLGRWQAWQAALSTRAAIPTVKAQGEATGAVSGPSADERIRARADGLRAYGLTEADISFPPVAGAAGTAGESLQQRVEPWLMACFGAEIAGDTVERNHRFLEESLELVQACGCTASEAHQLVDYTFGRPVGEKHQEAGGVMITLAALCRAQGIDMHEQGEVELARIWTMVEKIRAKQAAKPKHSPLPALPPTPPAAGTVPLTVWFGPMPESNGKTNWTAILHRGDLVEGHTIGRSEHHDRVRYEADCVRYLIGELPVRPDILAYDPDLLSPAGTVPIEAGGGVAWCTFCGKSDHKEAECPTIAAGVAPCDGWQQYAKEGETAQACIERHRGEQDALLKLLAQAPTPLSDEQVIALLPAGWTGMLAQVMEFARRVQAARGVQEVPRG